MLFRPSFCCNCGEKIERTEWRVWTSRRFCDLCATDFSLQDYAARGVILLAAVVTLFGIVSWFKGPGTRELVASKSVERTQIAKPANTAPVQTPALAQPTPAQPANTADERAPRALAAMPAANSPTKAAVETSEAVYICGAATKKGTPCSRKVKGLVRCWQHTGQAAMLPPDQLRVGR